MPRHVAFLRGVSPLTATMPDLRRCFEAAGFTNVRTVLGSGNVVFDTTLRSDGAVERRAEAAMAHTLDRTFHTIARSVAELERLLAADPFAAYDVAPGAKRVVSFLRSARAPRVSLPLHGDAAAVLGQVGREAFTAYVPGGRSPVFMQLIERAFGTEVTTRTWETVRRCAAA